MVRAKGYQTVDQTAGFGSARNPRARVKNLVALSKLVAQKNAEEAEAEKANIKEDVDSNEPLLTREVEEKSNSNEDDSIGSEPKSNKGDDNDSSTKGNKDDSSPLSHEKEENSNSTDGDDGDNSSKGKEDDDLDDGLCEDQDEDVDDDAKKKKGVKAMTNKANKTQADKEASEAASNAAANKAREERIKKRDQLKQESHVKSHSEAVTATAQAPSDSNNNPSTEATSKSAEIPPFVTTNADNNVSSPHDDETVLEGDALYFQLEAELQREGFSLGFGRDVFASAQAYMAYLHEVKVAHISGTPTTKRLKRGDFIDNAVFLKYYFPNGKKRKSSTTAGTSNKKAGATKNTSRLNIGQHPKTPSQIVSSSSRAQMWNTYKAVPNVQAMFTPETKTDGYTRGTDPELEELEDEFPNVIPLYGCYTEMAPNKAKGGSNGFNKLPKGKYKLVLCAPSEQQAGYIQQFLKIQVPPQLEAIGVDVSLEFTTDPAELMRQTVGEKPKTRKERKEPLVKEEGQNHTASKDGDRGQI